MKGKGFGSYGYKALAPTGSDGLRSSRAPSSGQFQREVKKLNAHLDEAQKRADRTLSEIKEMIRK